MPTPATDPSGKIRGLRSRILTRSGHSSDWTPSEMPLESPLMAFRSEAILSAYFSSSVHSVFRRSEAMSRPCPTGPRVVAAAPAVDIMEALKKSLAAARKPVGRAEEMTPEAKPERRATKRQAAALRTWISTSVSLPENHQRGTGKRGSHNSGISKHPVKQRLSLL